MDHSSRLVLVVDDDRDTREMYRLMFEMAGRRVEAAGSIADAVRIARGDAPAVGVCDWRLPDGDGLALAAALRAHSAGTVLLAVTGATLDGPTRERAEELGFAHVLVKPVMPDTLVLVVDEILGKAKETAVGPGARGHSGVVDRAVRGRGDIALLGDDDRRS